jgi:hypothetical protein
MKPVDQRGPNDCLRAAIASVFEIAYEDAPDCAIPLGMSDDDRSFSQHNIVSEWLKARGLVEWQINGSGPNPCLRRGELVHSDGTREPADYNWPYPMATHYIGGGTSPRGRGHSVVMFCGKIIHDPHPDKDMTIDRITSIHVYCARLP